MKRALVYRLMLAAVTLDVAAEPLAPEAALACAAARYRGEALRIAAHESGTVQELRWRTPAGKILEIRLAGPGCRFLEVRGVGQVSARILPQGTP